MQRRWYDDPAIADAFTPIVTDYLTALQARNEALQAGGRPPRAVALVDRCNDTGEPLRWSEDDRGFVFDHEAADRWYDSHSAADYLPTEE